jgi:hypothetical protein
MCLPKSVTSLFEASCLTERTVYGCSCAMQFQGVTFVDNKVWLVMEYMAGGTTASSTRLCWHDDPTCFFVNQTCWVQGQRQLVVATGLQNAGDVVALWKKPNKIIRQKHNGGREKGAVLFCGCVS